MALVHQVLDELAAHADCSCGSCLWVGKADPVKDLARRRVFVERHPPVLGVQAELHVVHRRSGADIHAVVVAGTFYPYMPLC
jgi:hypothetical protein